MTDAIVVDNVSKKYRRTTERARRISEAFVKGWRRRRAPEEFWALRSVSFRLAAGRMLGIIGRNGAGKSTLLKLICGVGRPTSGRIETHGAIRALLELGSTFHPDLSGRENVFLSGVVSGLTRREVEHRFDAIVDFAELESFADNPVRTYSSGMRTRLAFSVAVHTDPSILIVDEALAVGDIAFQNKCLERIAQFRERGCAILLASHETSFIRELSDEALWLRNGEIAAYGEPEDVVGHYVGELMVQTRKRTSNAHPPTRSSAGLDLRMNETRFGSLELQIRDVVLENSRGIAVEEIDPGTALTVKIKFESELEIVSPHFVVTILREDGVVCFDSTSERGGLLLPRACGRGAVAIRIERLDLVGGLYYVDVGAYEREWSYAYDFHHRVYPIRLREGKSIKGVLSAPHEWELVKRVEPTGALPETRAL